MVCRSVVPVAENVHWVSFGEMAASRLAMRSASGFMCPTRSGTWWKCSSGRDGRWASASRSARACTSGSTREGGAGGALCWARSWPWPTGAASGSDCLRTLRRLCGITASGTRTTAPTRIRSAPSRRVPSWTGTTSGCASGAALRGSTSCHCPSASGTSVGPLRSASPVTQRTGVRGRRCSSALTSRTNLVPKTCTPESETVPPSNVAPSPASPRRDEDEE
ncbi:hypothetical protein STAL104432_04985 [Streptomyces albus]